MGEREEQAHTRSNAALVDAIVPLGFLLFVLVLAYQVFAPVFPAMLWGALLAVICAHPYERLAGRLKGGRKRADAVFGVLLLMVLLLPALFFAWELLAILPTIEARLASLGTGAGADPVPLVPDWLADLPLIGAPLAEAWRSGSTDLAGRLPELLNRFGGVANWMLAQVGGLRSFLFEFVLGAVLSLFLLHHRFAFRAFLHRLLTRVGGDFATGLVLSSF